MSSTLIPKECAHSLRGPLGLLGALAFTTQDHWLPVWKRGPEAERRECWGVRRKWVRGLRGLGRCKDGEGTMLEERLCSPFEFPVTFQGIVVLAPSSSSHHPHTHPGAQPRGRLSNCWGFACAVWHWASPLSRGTSNYACVNEEAVLHETGKSLSEWEEGVQLKKHIKRSGKVWA